MGHIIATMSHGNEDLARSTFSNLSAPCAVAVGKEADGLWLKLLAGADLCVRIEMPIGSVGSLNVAATAGIVLHAMAVEEHTSNGVEGKKRRKAAMQAHAEGTEKEPDREAA